MKYLKKHWKKIIGIIAVVAILVFAYWYGGRTPDSKGFSIGSDVSSTTQASDSSEQLADASNDQMVNASDDQLEDQNTSEEEIEESTEADQQKDANSSEEESVGHQSSKDTNQTGGPSETSGNSEHSSESGEQSDGKNEAGNTQTGNKNEPTTQAPVSEPEVYTCTISIYCDTVLNNMDLLDPAKVSIIPSSGCILSAKTVEFTPGESVFDVLQRVARQYGIPLEYSYTAIYGSSYIEGINNLYEFDCGEASGWIYLVNGSYPGYGSSQYVLNDKDVIKWVYTCNFGADVGNPY